MGTQRRVLVIDDDRDFLECMRIILEAQGYEIFTTDSAEEGLQLARQIRPHAILMDCMISYVLDGLNILRTMRSEPEFGRTPIIMISAILSADANGLLSPDQPREFDAFMSKPVEPAALLKKLDEMITQAQQPE